MKKITTLFKKDPADLGRVINEIDPENAWALEPEAVATRKFDGTACAIIEGELYKRYDAKNGKPAPVGGIPCQEPDPITGHWPHWVKCDQNNPADKWAFEGLKNMIRDHCFSDNWDGTYELCGPKVGGNPEGLPAHYLLKHGFVTYLMEVNSVPRTYEGIRDYLSRTNIEGIVFHHPDGRMCKIRKSDFGFKREKPQPAPVAP